MSVYQAAGWQGALERSKGAEGHLGGAANSEMGEVPQAKGPLAEAAISNLILAVYAHCDLDYTGE